jgi:hypothetical protein
MLKFFFTPLENEHGFDEIELSISLQKFWLVVRGENGGVVKK